MEGWGLWRNAFLSVPQGPFSCTLSLPRRGARHTTIMDDVRVALCKHHVEHPKLTQAQHVNYLQTNSQLRFRQAAVSYALKRKANIVQISKHSNSSDRCHQHEVKFRSMGSALLAWLNACQDHTNLCVDFVVSMQSRFCLSRSWDELFQFFNRWP